jgi:hypothetical protein
VRRLLPGVDGVALRVGIMNLAWVAALMLIEKIAPQALAVSRSVGSS